ncbi:MAG: hypothetical protein KDA42_17420 [Planctomycetales bacterium]|nr:hypothetical protein [Planctomycetales bacterium]
MEDEVRPGGATVAETLKILLVEESAHDRARIQRALESTGARFDLESLSNSEDASAWLLATMQSHPESLPDLILVALDPADLSTARLLAEIRCHDPLREIPVIALAAPLRDGDALEAFDLEARLCLVKTADLAVLADRLRRAMRCCCGHFPLRIDANDRISQVDVTDSLIVKLAGPRPRGEQAQAGDEQRWRPLRRDLSFWRRRRSA